MIQRARARLVSRVRSLVTRQVVDQGYETLLLQGRMASWRVRAMKSLQTLDEAEFKVFSQWGEDGIIDWLIERLAIPPRLHSFVEFGVYDYTESNTHFLLENRSWRGLILDGNPDLKSLVDGNPRRHRYDLIGKPAFITRENINELIGSAGFRGEIGLLSVDIDGNDYWVWEAIDVVQPVICICEINGFLGDLHAVSIPYDATFVCGMTRPERQYFGASLAAMRSLAERKGYRFVGSNRAGNDVFFVREDYASRLDGTLERVAAWPATTQLPVDQPDGTLRWISVEESMKMIENLPFIQVETGQKVTLKELKPLFSDEMLEIVTGRSRQQAVN
jgi:hypothetical protein